MCRVGVVAALGVLSLMLGGCGETRSSAVQCPAVVNYTDAQLAAIQQAIDRLAKDDPLRRTMQDYENLRDDARYCANLLKEQR